MNIIEKICLKMSKSSFKPIKIIGDLYFKYKEIINYLIVGGLTTLVSIGSYALFRLFIESLTIKTVLSWTVAVVFAYITNRIFVFESRNKKVLVEFIKFIGARLLTLGTELLTMYILVKLIKFDDLISKILVQFIIVILNYILSKIFVFKKRKNTV